MKMRPAWKVSKVERGGPFGWHHISREQAETIRSKLSSFESMTWFDILIDSKKFHHIVATEKLSKEAQKRLIEIELDDQDELVSLRLGGTERVWGLREKNAFLLLWWDPEHKVYPSPKKYT